MIIARCLRRDASMTLVLTLAAVACGGSSDEGETEQSPVVAVETAVVTTQPFVETLGAIGTVTARPGHIASLGAPMATRVSSVHVSEGSRVARGQPLVELDRSAIASAAQAASAALTAAEQAYDRAERLNREGVAPRKDVEQAAADLAQARAGAVAARRAEELAVLRSPIDGVVTRLSAVLGAPVDANQPLIEIADPAALDLVLTVTPTDAATVHAGETVQLSAGQRAGGETLGTGTVTQVAAAVDSATRGIAVRVRATGVRRPLRIGETIFGRIAVATHANALAVPTESLVPSGEGFKVFTVDASSIAHEHPVTVGARSDSTAEILTGLAAGDRVVTYGAYGVEDSVKVTMGARRRGTASALGDSSKTP